VVVQVKMTEPAKNLPIIPSGESVQPLPFYRSDF